MFDVDREELGFLTVALLSCEEWVREEKEKWAEIGRACPVTIEELEKEIKRRDMEGIGDL